MNNIRKSFEKWCKVNNLRLERSKTMLGGDLNRYDFPPTQFSWEIWEEAWNAANEDSNDSESIQLIRLITEQTREICYCGIMLQVPFGLNYIATDEDGDVHGFEFRPHPHDSMSLWDTQPGRTGKIVLLATVNLKHFDWKDTLVEL